MINRENYQDIQHYLDFQKTTIQCDDSTITSLWSRLKHLLIWADETRFSQADKIKQKYPVYLGDLKKPDGANLIGTAHFAACCKTARAFFKWAKVEYPREYKEIMQGWIVSIKPPRSRSEQSELKQREIYEVEEVIKLATFPVESLKFKRMQAAVALLFMSGMRISALVSLPVSCVHLDQLKVDQLPEKGVLTKNHKAAITTLLNIPELFQVVKGWNDFLRANALPEALWYVNLSYHGEIAKTNPTAERMKTRNYDFRGDLHELCKVAGIEYKSPHKFRHGHAVYALKRAKDMKEMKAISQNLMHSTMGITDGIYGNLVNDDVHDVISSLAGNETNGQINQETLTKIADLLYSKMSQNRPQEPAKTIQES